MKRKHSELEAMSPTVRSIVTTMTVQSAVKSPPLSKKLSLMTDKIGKEPNGVSLLLSYPIWVSKFCVAP